MTSIKSTKENLNTYSNPPWDYHAIVPGLILNKSLKTNGHLMINIHITYTKIHSIQMTQNTKHRIVHQQIGSNKIGDTQWEETTLCANNLYMHESVTASRCTVSG